MDGMKEERKSMETPKLEFGIVGLGRMGGGLASVGGANPGHCPVGDAALPFTRRVEAVGARSRDDATWVRRPSFRKRPRDCSGTPRGSRRRSRKGPAVEMA